LKRQPGKHLALLVGADHQGFVERARGVAIRAAGNHRFQSEAFAVDPARRPQKAAMHEAAIAPQVGAGKQKEVCAVVAGPGRAGGQANATSHEGCGDDSRRAYATPATH
jgi:hypothetical protein